MELSAALAMAGLGVVLGFRHAFEPDHLIAVATMVAGEPDGKTAARFGASWGIGHAVSLIAVGAALSLARAAMPGKMGVLLEAFVAVMVIGIGIRAVYRGWSLRHSSHVSGRTQGDSLPASSPGATDLRVGPIRLPRQPLAVGMVHGLAGSGALTALAVSTLAAPMNQFVFMLLFGLGSTAGMTGAAGLAGLPLAHLVRRPAGAAALSIAAGVTAIVFGLIYGQPLIAHLLSS